MTGDSALTNRGVLTANWIQDLISDGFEVGGYSGVNSSGDNYAYVAFEVTDSGTSAATFAAGEDVKLIGLAKQTPKRLRFLVSNEGDQTQSNIQFELQVAEKTTDCASATYSKVSTHTHWEMVGSSAFFSYGRAGSSCVMHIS